MLSMEYAGAHRQHWAVRVERGQMNIARPDDQRLCTVLIQLGHTDDVVSHLNDLVVLLVR